MVTKDIIQCGYDLSLLLTQFAARSSDTSMKLLAKDAIDAWDMATKILPVSVGKCWCGLTHKPGEPCQ